MAKKQKANKGDSLKKYGVAMVAGAVTALTLAELARRKMGRESYLANLRPAPVEESSPDPEPPSHGPTRQAAGRAWSAVAASARADHARLRRIRARAPRARTMPEEPAEAHPPTT
jgi:hypothetical protein